MAAHSVGSAKWLSKKSLKKAEGPQELDCGGIAKRRLLNSALNSVKGEQDMLGAPLV
jgi:hypothetical protein